MFFHKFTQLCVADAMGTTPGVIIVWSPYRITPIYWLMVRDTCPTSYMIEIDSCSRHLTPQIFLTSVGSVCFAQFFLPISLWCFASVTASVEYYSPSGEWNGLSSVPDSVLSSHLEWEPAPAQWSHGLEFGSGARGHGEWAVFTFSPSIDWASPCRFWKWLPV